MATAADRPLEEQQQGVAAELEQHAAALAGEIEHVGEHAAEPADQLLAAHAPPLREALGECREA
jgi:hypothetical protein